MRFSGLTLSIALILYIQFGSVLAGISTQEITGTWSNPNISPRTMKTYDLCCIPTSITITGSSSSGYTATYEFAGSSSIKSGSPPENQCANLFIGSNTGTKLTLTRYFGQLTYQASASILRGSLEIFTFTPNDDKLSISFSKKYTSFLDNNLPYDYHTCNFTMQTYKEPSNPEVYIVWVIIFVGISFCVWKKYQQKQANILAQQKFQQERQQEQQSYPAGVPVVGYVAPIMGYPQQYAQQPMVMPQANVQFQAGFPQQPVGMPMPQAQVTMNVNADEGRTM